MTNNILRFSVPANLISISVPPKTVGYWKFPGDNIYWSCVSKPNIFHRTMMQIVFGLKWKEEIGTED